MEKCFHGGKIYDLIGYDFAKLHDTNRVLSADVLDAWYDPAPEISEFIAQNINYICRASPSASINHVRTLLAEEFKTQPEYIIVGQGSSDLIFRVLPSLVDEKGTVFLEPAYGEYRHVVQNILELPAYGFNTEPHDFDLDVDALIKYTNDKGASAVVLVNPCNPTGKVYSKEKLIKLRKSLNPNICLIIDETYSEYIAREASMIDALATHDNLCIFKSLSKSYALSGLRAGFCAWNNEKTAWHHRRTQPYVIATATQSALYKIFEKKDYYASMISRTHVIRDYFVAQITAQLPQIRCVDSAINAVLLNISKTPFQAQEVVDQLYSKNILVRNIDSQGMLEKGQYIRISILSEEDMHLILRALLTIFAHQQDA